MGRRSTTGFRWRYVRILERAGLTEKSGRQYMLHIHTLRKFFRSNSVGVDVSFREHWMGHKGGYQDVSYFRAEEKKHLEQYRRMLPSLRIYKGGDAEAERKIEEMRRSLDETNRRLDELERGR